MCGGQVTSLAGGAGGERSGGGREGGGEGDALIASSMAESSELLLRQEKNLKNLRFFFILPIIGQNFKAELLSPDASVHLQGGI